MFDLGHLALLHLLDHEHVTLRPALLVACLHGLPGCKLILLLHVLKHTGNSARHLHCSRHDDIVHTQMPLPTMATAARLHSTMQKLTCLVAHALQTSTHSRSSTFNAWLLGQISAPTSLMVFLA